MGALCVWLETKFCRKFKSIKKERHGGLTATTCVPVHAECKLNRCKKSWKIDDWLCIFIHIINPWLHVPLIKAEVISREILQFLHPPLTLSLSAARRAPSLEICSLLRSRPAVREKGTHCITHINITQTAKCDKNGKEASTPISTEDKWLLVDLSLSIRVAGRSSAFVFSSFWSLVFIVWALVVLF